MLFLVTYQGQSLQVLQAKDLKLALKIADLPSLLENLSSKHDTSSLAKILIVTAIRDNRVDANELKPCLEALVKDHLKTTYTLVQAAIFESI